MYCCISQGVKQVLVKLGDKGSALFVEGEEPFKQAIISAPKVLDTTGAGDTFTAAFAVALVESKSKQECLKFAGKNPFLSYVFMQKSLSNNLLLVFLQLQQLLFVFKSKELFQACLIVNLF